MLLLAMIGGGQRAYRQYYFDQTHSQSPKIEFGQGSLKIRCSHNYGCNKLRILSYGREYFTFTKHRHVAGEPPQWMAKGNGGGGALCSDEGRHQPHGHKVVYPTIDECRR